MAYKQINGAQRSRINNLRDRAWAAGLTDATFSQIAKNPEDWERRVAAAEQSKAEQAAAEEATLATDEVGVKTVDANALIASLRQAGMSVRAIAAAVGVHISTVYRWARGLFAPIASRYTKLAALAA